MNITKIKSIRARTHQINKIQLNLILIMLKTIKRLKKYYIAYKRVKAIRLTRYLIEQIPNKQLSHHRLNFYLYQLEQTQLEQTPIPYLTQTLENLKKKYPRITNLLTKYFYLILLILYTLKGISILLIGYLFYSK